MSANEYRLAAGRSAPLLLLLASLACGSNPGPVSAESQESQDLSGGPEVSVLHGDVSGPLRDLPAVVPQERIHREKPLFPFHAHGPAANQPDPVLQSIPGPFVATTPGLNFAGVGNGDYMFAPNAGPPDTNGAVGATQYVQWMNESFAVFNKSTGALV